MRALLIVAMLLAGFSAGCGDPQTMTGPSAIRIVQTGRGTIREPVTFPPDSDLLPPLPRPPAQF